MRVMQQCIVLYQIIQGDFTNCARKFAVVVIVDKRIHGAQQHISSTGNSDDTWRQFESFVCIESHMCSVLFKQALAYLSTQRLTLMLLLMKRYAALARLTILWTCPYKPSTK
jgi:hypothetical protein